MKKFAALLLTALVMSLGFVSASGTASNAATPGICPKAPYTGCVKTYTWASHPASTVHVAKRSKTYHLSVRPSVGAGNLAPTRLIKGTVTVVLKLNGRTIWNRTKAYPGSTVSGYLKTGRYTVIVTFKPAKGSVLKGSSRSYGFTVKR